MPQFMRRSSARGQEEEKLDVRGATKRSVRFSVVAATVAAIAAFSASTLLGRPQANDKYSLKSPGGIAFSDFRGYEDWAVVSTSHTDERLKVIVGNATMVNAFKAGVPANDQTFPDGSMIVKLQWTQKKSAEAPFVVDVPEAFKEAFVMEKDSKRFPNSGGWGYALFNYDATSDTFTPDAAPDNCGHACHMAVKAKDYIFHPYQKR